MDEENSNHLDSYNSLSEEDSICDLQSAENEEKARLIDLRNTSMKALYSLLDNFIKSGDVYNASQLGHWIEDLVTYKKFEKEFIPSKLIKYERGNILKVNLGYNVGNEENGLHYCVVLDKSNDKNSGVITVIPLTSFKGKKLYYSSVNLGNEIYNSLKEKLNEKTKELNSIATEILTHKLGDDATIDERNEYSKKLVEASKKIEYIEKLDYEINKMKTGSVALVNQITTISKQKIYDPQKTYDIFAGVKLSDENLDKINSMIKKVYIK